MRTISSTSRGCGLHLPGPVRPACLSIAGGATAYADPKGQRAAGRRRHIAAQYVQNCGNSSRLVRRAPRRRDAVAQANTSVPARGCCRPDGQVIVVVNHGSRSRRCTTSSILNASPAARPDRDHAGPADVHFTAEATSIAGAKISSPGPAMSSARWPYCATRSGCGTGLEQQVYGREEDGQPRLTLAYAHRRRQDAVANPPEIRGRRSITLSAPPWRRPGT
jgi:hypothetical protein